MTLRAPRFGASLLPLLLLLLALFAASCSSAPEAEKAGELLFPGGEPTPTSVPLADAEFDSDPSDADAAPPDRLAFADWTVDDLIARLGTSLDSPARVAFSGNGGETLEIDGESWRVAGQHFVTRGQGTDEWVTFEQVAEGSRAIHEFAAASSGASMDELLNATDLSDEPILQQFLADRVILEQTSSLSTMWVPYDRDDDAFFMASVVHPGFVDRVLLDISAALAAADLAGSLDTTSTDDDFTTTIPDTQYASVSVDRSGSRISVVSQGGWTLVITNGVEHDAEELGLPNVRDILTAKLLLTELSLPSGCATPVVEARSLVENGLVICQDSASLGELIKMDIDPSLPVE